ncbi:hypothetical protein ACFQGT_03390 [Natrialbaceae archaeon GCM10025810]|uniref:DUF5789 family protein n=1 Tax=Halovalidus salilacus TaxID=3075124 RepID=UPI00361109F5
MGDTKSSREKQAADEERRQRERELEEALERDDETEPTRADPDADHRLGDLDDAFDDLDYPVASDELLEAYGDRTVESRDGWTSVDEAFEPVDDETYDSAADVRDRIRELTNRE